MTSTEQRPPSSTLDLRALQTTVRGELIRPTDTHYDEARALFNGMIDKHPALIVRCTDVADNSRAPHQRRADVHTARDDNSRRSVYTDRPASQPPFPDAGSVLAPGLAQLCARTAGSAHRRRPQPAG